MLVVHSIHSTTVYQVCPVGVRQAWTAPSRGAPTSKAFARN